MSKYVYNIYTSVQFKLSKQPKFNIEYGVKIKEVTNERLKQYQDELNGSIILSIDNDRATDVESVSRILNSKDENQSSSVQLLTKNRQLIRIII